MSQADWKAYCLETWPESGRDIADGPPTHEWNGGAKAECLAIVKWLREIQEYDGELFEPRNLARQIEAGAHHTGEEQQG